MSWRNDQFLPRKEVVRKVSDDVLLPELLATCARLGIPHPPCVRVGVWVNDELKLTFRVQTTADGPSSGANAEIRLRFRRTFKAERSLFFAQLMMDQRDDRTGFVGILIRGEVKAIEGQYLMRAPLTTTIYNSSCWLTPGGA